MIFWLPNLHPPKFRKAKFWRVHPEKVRFLLGQSVLLKKTWFQVFFSLYPRKGFFATLASYSKSSSRSCDCLKIDLKVPKGISFLPSGTITVNIGTPYFLNFAWLPFCDAKTKPFAWRTLMIAFDEKSLGMLKLFRWNNWIVNLGQIRNPPIF